MLYPTILMLVIRAVGMKPGVCKLRPSAGIGCPNKSARFKARAIVILLGWRHWKCNICHLLFLRLVIMDRYTKERVIYFLNKWCILLQK